MSEEHERQLKIFAGIEGGATRSTTVLIREDGKVLSWVDGVTTNYHLVGLDKCQETIKGMIDAAKVKASVDDSMNWMLSPDWAGLDGVGMGLSGCEDAETNTQFVEKLLERYPNMAKDGVAVSDTIGSIYTACPDGGIVLISGTGSNSLLLNPDGTEERCGGWGHLLGDEGASYWIALRGIKWVIDTEENFNPCPYSIERAKATILRHFEVSYFTLFQVCLCPLFNQQISNLFGLITHFYSKFNKSHFSGLAAKLAACEFHAVVSEVRFFSLSFCVFSIHLIP